MAVTRISADDAEWGSSGGTSGSETHTVSSGTDILVVSISFFFTGTDNVTCTWNGTSLTRQVASESGSGKEGGAKLTLANPDVGTYTLAWNTGTASAAAGTNIIAHSYQGASGTIVDTNSANTTSENQALNISFTGGATGDMIVGCAGGWQTANGVTGNSQTLLNDILTNNDYLETIEKAWSGDPDLATTDTDFGWLGGIVLGASAAGAVIGPYNVVGSGGVVGFGSNILGPGGPIG